MLRNLFGLKTQSLSSAPLSQRLPWEGWDRLDRFLCLGAEGAQYVAGERTPSAEEARHTLGFIKSEGMEAVERIQIVSGSGRALRPEPCLFALALAASQGSPEVRQAALASLPTVARTASQLFAFIQISEGMRGWGRGYRRAIASWYTQANPLDLAHQVMRHRTREGWAHRDVLRLSHPKPETPEHKAVFGWIAGKGASGLPLLEAFEELQTAPSVARAAGLIRDHRLPREAVPPQLQSSPEIWEALLEDMPYQAVLSNLGNMTQCGLVAPGSEGARKVGSRLTDEARIRIARVHPVAVLMASAAYLQGRGWTPSPEALASLEAAFGKAASLLSPTDKRILVAIDTSGSMHEAAVGGSLATPAAASSAFAVSLLHRDPSVSVMAIGSSYKPAPLNKGWSLSSCLAGLPKGGFGSMDCSLPIVHAMKARQEVDAFVVITDRETVFRDASPRDALLRYREAMGIPARLAIIGMTSGGFRLADEEDKAMLDVVGFDAMTPYALHQFLAS